MRPPRPFSRRPVFARLARIAGLGLVSITLLTPVVPDAAAQTRRLPPEADRGTVWHVREMLVSIDGTQRLLAPGAVIRDHQNLIIVPVSLPAQGAPADYTIDSRGQVDRIWLLTPEEAAAPRPRKAAP